MIYWSLDINSCLKFPEREEIFEVQEGWRNFQLNFKGGYGWWTLITT